MRLIWWARTKTKTFLGKSLQNSWKKLNNQTVWTAAKQRMRWVICIKRRAKTPRVLAEIIFNQSMPVLHLLNNTEVANSNKVGIILPREIIEDVLLSRRKASWWWKKSHNKRENAWGWCMVPRWSTFPQKWLTLTTSLRKSNSSSFINIVVGKMFAV